MSYPPEMLSVDEINQTRKYEWKIKKAVAEKIVACGGSIFGGAVRDMYRHDMHAEIYYSEHISNGIFNYSTEYIKYQDTSYLPNTLGRLDVPSDIDACIPESKEIDLLDAFKQMNMTLIKKWDRDPSGYLCSCTIVNGQVKHYRYEVVPKKKIEVNALMKTNFPVVLISIPAIKELFEKFQEQLELLPIKPFELDLMVIKDDAIVNFKVDAPFGNLDFECNGLIMDKRGIRLSEHVKPDIKNPIQRQKELSRVLDDVLHKKAIMCERVTVARTKKMFTKGWSIESKNIQIVTSSYIIEQSETSSDDGSSSTGGHCIICHEDCENPHYKMKCCDARYHSKCLIDCWNKGDHCIITTYKCPMCRTNVGGYHTDDIYISTLYHHYMISRIPLSYNPLGLSLSLEVD